MEHWYEKSFGPDYLIVYKHRDFAGARREVERMVQWLNLPAGASVLDLCCGMGRHSLALAEMGYKVTGVDLSEPLLAEARAADAEGRVRWHRGDMRDVPLEGGFDAVVNLFTSFGYFDTDEENRRVLEEISRLLQPGGRWLLDFLNASWVESRLVPHSVRKEGDLTIDERRVVEDGFVRKTITLSEPGRPDRVYHEQVRMYGLDDFRRLLAGTGLRIDAVHGSYEAEEYTERDSPRLILVGSKDGGDGA
ncbi:class I SAM-dependent methyltransferase [Paenibacillus thermoaerophilus]|uniref:Class I SAM-dependent methyltransferase n=1 Tax=Paenibacillus thermoaerophilus TaxID=1215385 RepID=A0ABW2V7A4_9BACL|nr:class I SAM-dependent methyltransferase [Paenibacillus thermoaerophilus]TMV17666.1 methyltransferase domain-containing protein [Paenibacillus thermoaerophilus]